MEGCWRLEDNPLTWTIFHEFVSGGIELKFLYTYLQKQLGINLQELQEEVGLNLDQYVSNGRLRMMNICCCSGIRYTLTYDTFIAFFWPSVQFHCTCFDN